MNSLSTSSNPVFTVKSLVGELRSILESNYRQIVVEGEISGLARPASGHLYFSLKEGNSLIRCAFFRNRRLGSSNPEEGMLVQVRGQVSVYESRGDLQLIVSKLQPAGEGALQRAFALLKKKLLAEGLFDSAHKQPLPEIPRRIGIVSSLSAAALQDIRVTLKRRFPAARLIIYPTLVQGDQAPASLSKAIQTAGNRQEVDVLIIARGGGALEDLQAFNDETVARAIFNCPLPTVSGVGHETDFTIADMVADKRAPTPTAAAEMVTPDGARLLRECWHLQKRLIDITERLLDQRRQSVDYACAKLVHPTQRLQAYRLQQKNLTKTLISLIRFSTLQTANHIQRTQMRVSAHNPIHLVQQCRQQLNTNRSAILRETSLFVKERTILLGHKHSQLKLVSPMQTLERGYTILQNPKGQVISGIKQLKKETIVTATLHDGAGKLKVDDTSTKS